MNTYTVKVVSEAYSNGDYLTRIKDISLEELRFIRKVVLVIKANENKWSNYIIEEQYAGKLSEEDIDKFDLYVQDGSYKIISIEVTPIIKWDKVL